MGLMTEELGFDSGRGLDIFPYHHVQTSPGAHPVRIENVLEMLSPW
jgi:hypothetical protein